MDDDLKGVTLFKDGRWLIQKTRNNKIITRRGRGGEQAARKALEQIERELTEHVENHRAAKRLGVTLAPDGAPVPSLTFAQLFEDKYKPWAATELDPVTWRSREAIHWHLLSFFGNKRLDEITSAMVDHFKAKRMSEGVIYRTAQAAQTRKPRLLSKAGLAEQLKVLRAILRWAVKRGHLKHAPEVEMPKEKRGAPGAAKPVRYFTVEERVRYLRRAKPALADVTHFGLLTGARPAEIFHTRCRSIDLQRRTITIEEQTCPLCAGGRWIPKVGAWRVVEIAPDLLPILRRLLTGKRAEDLLFDSVHGQPFTRLHGGGGSFNRTLRMAGLERLGLSFYSLRHTFAADLATAGVPLTKIAKLMGHTDLRSTQRYAHLMPTALDGVVAHLHVPDAWGAATGAAEAHSNVPALSVGSEEVAAAG